MDYNYMAQIHVCVFSLQLIYDDGSGTFGYISVDLKKVPTEPAKSLRMIGVDIPNDMRY